MLDRPGRGAGERSAHRPRSCRIGRPCAGQQLPTGVGTCASRFDVFRGGPDRREPRRGPGRDQPGGSATNPNPSAQSFTFGIVAVQPGPDDVVGGAPRGDHVGSPVTDRRAAERAVDIRSTPPMTGTYEWVDSTVLQWSPTSSGPHTPPWRCPWRPSDELRHGPVGVGVASIADHTFTVTIDGHEAGPPSALPAPHHRAHWVKRASSRFDGPTAIPDTGGHLPGAGQRAFGADGFQQRRRTGRQC